MPGSKITITVDDRELRKWIEKTKGPLKPKVVADGVEYGIYQEFGPAENSPSGRVWAFRPFMRPSVEELRPSFNKAMRKALWVDQAQAVIDKTAFDLEKRAKDKVRVDTGALKNSIHVVDGEQFTITFEKLKGGKVIE